MSTNDTIILQADNGKYVVSELHNGLMGLYANGNQKSEALELEVVIPNGWPVNGDAPTINLIAKSSEYVSLHGETVVLDKTGAVDARAFKVTWRGVGIVALEAVNGKFVSRETNGETKLYANQDEVHSWESFKMIKTS